MDINELKPNSYKSREEKDIPEPSPVKKSINGSGTIKKKSPARRMADLFLSEDIHDIKGYLINNILIPKIKDLLSETTHGTIDMLLYGKQRVSSRGGSRNSSYINYRGISSNTSTTGSRLTNRPTRNLGDIEFSTDEYGTGFDKIEEVVGTMEEIMNQYKKVRVADLYEASGISNISSTDNYYGWTSMEGFRKIHNYQTDTWILEVPRAIEL